jgi:hypothetical protein
MNPQFFQACHFPTTQATWVCGLVQPSDLRPLQRAYGKRRGTAKSGLCSTFEGSGPVVGQGLAVAGAAWIDYTDPTLPPEIGPVRLLSATLSWTPAKPTSGQHTVIQQFEGSCANANWDQAGLASAPENDAEFDLAAGSGRTFIYSTQPGAVYCFRMHSLLRTADGTTGPVTDGAPVELVVPGDPAAAAG